MRTVRWTGRLALRIDSRHLTRPSHPSGFVECKRGESWLQHLTIFAQELRAMNEPNHPIQTQIVPVFVRILRQLTVSPNIPNHKINVIICGGSLTCRHHHHFSVYRVGLGWRKTYFLDSGGMFFLQGVVVSNLTRCRFKDKWNPQILSLCTSQEE